MRHLIVVVIVMAIYGGSLFYKDSLNQIKSAKEPVTVFSLRKEKGTPVKTYKLTEKTIASYFSVSGFLEENGEITTEIARDIATKIKTGTKAFADLDGKRYEGTVIYMANKESIMSGLYAAKIKFKYMPLKMKGKLVLAWVLNQKEDNALVLPRDAVSYRKKEPEVYTVNENNQVKIKKVKLGLSNSESVAVSMGLSANENIVVSDQRDLVENELVYIVK